MAGHDVSNSQDSLDPDDELFDQFLESRGHEIEQEWISDHNKKQCPECYSIHSEDADYCSTCGWGEE